MNSELIKIGGWTVRQDAIVSVGVCPSSRPERPARWDVDVKTTGGQLTDSSYQDEAAAAQRCNELAILLWATT